MSWRNKKDTDTEVSFADGFENRLKTQTYRNIKVNKDYCVLVTYKNGEEFAIVFDNETTAKSTLRDMTTKIIEGLKAKVYSSNDGSVLVIFGNINFVTMVAMED